VSSEGFQFFYGMLTWKDFSVFISIGNIILFCLLMCKAPGSAKLLEAAGPEVLSSSRKCKASQQSPYHSEFHRIPTHIQASQ
jgi:hypothetical protein